MAKHPEFPGGSEARPRLGNEPFSARSIEENHRFAADGQARWRENDLYLLRLRGDEIVGREHLAHNRGRVLYENRASDR